MSETRKAIIISTGMDNLQLLAALKETELATGTSLDRIKGLYTRLSTEKAAMEARDNDASLARLAKNMEAKIVLQKQYFAKQSALYEEQAAVQAIGGGSLPESLASGAAGASGVSMLGKEAAAAGKELHGSSTIVRETMVLFREGLRGNFTRMAGSLTILIGAIGSLAVVAAAATAAILAWPAIKTFQAFRSAKAGEADLGAASESAGRDLIPRIIKLQQSGQITAERAAELVAKARKGTNEDVNDVLTELHNLPSEKRKTASELDKQIQEKQVEYEREKDSLSTRYTNSQFKVLDIQGQMAKLSKDSIEYKQLELQLLDAQKDAAKDLEDLQREKNDKLKEQAELQKRLDDAQKEKAGIGIQAQSDYQRENEIYPTLQALARSGHMGSFFNRRVFQSTEAGETAGRILRLQRDQLNARLSGNINGADWDAGEIARLKGILSAAGFQPRDEKLESINNHIANVNANIASITAQATKDGLHVNITNVSDSH